MQVNCRLVVEVHPSVEVGTCSRDKLAGMVVDYQVTPTIEIRVSIADQSWFFHIRRQARRDESLDMAKTIAAETLKMQNRENREKDWAA